MSDEPLLSVRDLRTWFPIRAGVLRNIVGHVRAVDGVSLDVLPGETVALVGESGCGKTTVGRSILRLVEPSGGSVLYHGKDLLKLAPSELRPLRRRIQMIFQDPMTSLNPLQRIDQHFMETIQTHEPGD